MGFRAGGVILREVPVVEPAGVGEGVVEQGDTGRDLGAGVHALDLTPPGGLGQGWGVKQPVLHGGVLKPPQDSRLGGPGLGVQSQEAGQHHARTTSHA